MSIQVSRILHAGYSFECAGTQILFDPIFENPFSRNCHAYPAVDFDLKAIRLLKPQAVFISHFHDDHCSMLSLNELSRDTPVYIFCLFEEMLKLIRDLGFKQVYPLELNKTLQIGPFAIMPRRALDGDVDSLFQIRAEGFNILNVVDSWIGYDVLGQLEQEKPWDLILWPFQTMRELEVLSPKRAEPASAELPPEWIEQLQALKPKAIVPSSCQFLLEPWSWYNHFFFPITYRQFQKEVEAALPGVQVVRMDPSASVRLEPGGKITAGNPLPWVKLRDFRVVDYQFRPDMKIPKTSEIAKNFVALTEAESSRVHFFCTKELTEKYNRLGPSQEEYFCQSRIWQLKIYDHRGLGKSYYYHLESGLLRNTPDPLEEPSWLTEVPGSKLYAALELGESLTSMYVRLNECEFSAEVEEQIRSVEITEDPLIRSLFQGVFGSYQKAQLKMLNLK